eukprot:1969979-Rhodomonas_salina.1
MMMMMMMRRSTRKSLGRGARVPHQDRSSEQETGCQWLSSGNHGHDNAGPSGIHARRPASHGAKVWQSSGWS